jgi:hypothetical protein
MKKGVWDLCQLDPHFLSDLDEFSTLLKYETQGNIILNEEPENESLSSSKVARADGFQHGLSQAEESGRVTLQNLDSVIQILHQMRSAYDDVTGRTNSLVSKCENLLEQQHNLQSTVEILQKAIQPFDDIEQISVTLGIPYDAASNFQSKSIHEMTASNLDPRSPEFVDMLQKLSTAIAFLSDHPEIMDAEKYRNWLDKLQTRAVSLVGRAMRDLLDGAGRKCREIIQQKLYAKPQEKSLDDQPLESTALYQKFRGLSYRMKELSLVLFEGGLSKRDSQQNANSDDISPRYHSSRQSRMYEMRHTAKSTLTEVKRAYAVLRMELLVPFVKDAWLSALAQARVQVSSHDGLPGIGSGTNLASIVESKETAYRGDSRSPRAASGATDKLHLSLSGALRQVFAILVRVAQLEHQLYESLFAQQDSKSVASTPSSATTTQSRVASFRQPPTSNNSYSNLSEADLSELVQIVEAAGNATRDFLRPLIIKESSVDELCRVVSVLSEDMCAQISILPVPPMILKLLLTNLEITVNDAKERLTYCAETKLRQEVQLFEPLPSHVAYPDILEAFEEKKKQWQEDENEVDALTEGSNKTDNDNRNHYNAQLSNQELYQTWYPPMRQTLSLLSKLYGIVAPPVFEDFVRRGIESCVQTLRTGSEGVKRTHAVIHGDLFLVRHLLILREQLAPFDIKLQSIEKQLDFASTGLAFQELIAHQSRNLWRFDQQNGFLMFAKQGLPTMQELHTDAKKELDEALRKSCLAFKSSAVKMLLGPLDAFLAKVSAFLGEIPYQTGSGNVPTANTPTNMDSPLAEQEDSNSNLTSSGKRALKTPILTAEQKNLLKNQSFVRPERLKECLEQVQSLLVQRMPDVKELVKLYIDSAAAKSILLKSIIQEFDIAKRKMETVLVNCVDAGQGYRDIEHLLHTITRVVNAELSAQ